MTRWTPRTNKLHMHKRICTSCSGRVSKCVRWCSQHPSNIHTCTCMVPKTPVSMHAHSPQKIRMRSCMRAYTTVQKLLCHETIANLAWVLREHRAGCRLPPAVLPARRNQLPDAVRFQKFVQFRASSWRGRRCGVVQVSFDHVCWCRPHPVCPWGTLALGHGGYP